MKKKIEMDHAESKATTQAKEAASFKAGKVFVAPGKPSAANQENTPSNDTPAENGEQK